MFETPRRGYSIALFVAALLIQCTEGFLPSAQIQQRRAPPRLSIPKPTWTGSWQPQQQYDVSIPLRTSNNNNNPLGSGGNGVNDMDPGLKLLICILIDVIGVASFAAPGLGEATDVGWAPISAFLVNYLFGNGVFTALALVEELLPGFDIIPTATIAWCVENAANREEAAATASTSNNSAMAAPSTPTTAKRSSPPSDAIDVEVRE